MLTVPLPLPYALPPEEGPPEAAGAAEFWLRPAYSSKQPASAAAAAATAAAAAAQDEQLGRDAHGITWSAYAPELTAPLRKALADGDSWGSVVSTLQRGQRA